MVLESAIKPKILYEAKVRSRSFILIIKNALNI